MAYSGQTDIPVTGKQIIESALRKCGSLGEGEPASPNSLVDQALNLNMLMASFQADGLNLFTVKHITLFPLLGRNRYSIPDTSATSVLPEAKVVYAAYRSSVGASGGTTAEVYINSTDITDNIDSTYIIGWFNGTTVEWKPVVTSIAAGSEYLVTITGTFSAEPTDGDTIFFYAGADVLSDRPMKILESYAITSIDGSNLPMAITSRQGYDNLSAKSAAGIPNQLTFDPQLGSANLNIWPTVSAEDIFIEMRAKMPVDKIIDVEDTIYFPQEWFLALVLGLAEIISVEVGLPPTEHNKIIRMYARYYDVALGFDREGETSIFFQPDYSSGRSA